MILWDLNSIENLINRYIEKDGEYLELQEGCLGYGVIMLRGKGLKTTIIKEVYLNEWSSGHTVRMYNKTPKKYLQMAEKLEA